uniref:Ubiquinone biosynthesis O-methyltransferase, mitochondrial n=1 Tax=Panagrolaimus sp. JU765 TaxID=591449 RepID=A0AC34QTK8_9BILA
MLSSRYLVTKLVGNKFGSRFVSVVANTIDPNEVANFQRLSHEWMDENGPFKALHSYNRLRLPWIVNTLGKTPSPNSLKGLKIADVGCGGGLLSVPIARLGANVDGIDASEQAVKIAELTADRTLPTVRQNLNFHNTTVEDFAETNAGNYDAVIASEIIEHVSDFNSFLDGCVKLCKPGATLFFTTINKTISSQLMAIWLAENILGVLPPGMHDWDKFIEPKFLRMALEERDCRVGHLQGVIYNPLTNRWNWSGFDYINYGITATRTL